MGTNPAKSSFQEMVGLFLLVGWVGIRLNRLAIFDLPFGLIVKKNSLSACQGGDLYYLGRYSEGCAKQLKCQTLVKIKIPSFRERTGGWLGVNR